MGSPESSGLGSGSNHALLTPEQYHQREACKVTGNQEQDDPLLIAILLGLLFSRAFKWLLVQKILPSDSAQDQDQSQDASDKVATLHRLPDSILKPVFWALSFQDKCSLKLLCKGFHRLLSNPLPLEELWGRCKLMSDLRIDDKFDRMEDILR